MKLRGGIAPYMMGLVAGIALVSTLTAQQARLMNQQNENNYIKEKKEYATKLAESLKNSIYSEQTTSNSTFTNIDVEKYIYTNIFDANSTSSQVSSNTNSDGDKTASISVSSNAYNKAKALDADAISANLTDSDTSSFISEEDVRGRQLIASYKNMKEEARLIYSEAAGVSKAKLPCTLTNTNQDVWGRNFLFNRIDDYNAQLSFELPWDNTKKTTLDINLPEYPVKVTKIKHVYPTHYTSYLVTTDGEVYASGSNSKGQLGVGSSVTGYNGWQKITQLPTIEKMANVGYSFVAITPSGDVWSTGENLNGVLGLGVTGIVYDWTKTSLTNIKDIYMFRGNVGFAVSNDGKLYGAGDNMYGILGLGDTVERTSWELVPGAPVNIVSLDKHYNENAIALTDSGEVWVAGKNSSASLGLTHTSFQTTWHKVTEIPVPAVKVAVVDGAAVLALGSDGRLYGGGSIYYFGTSSNDKVWKYLNIDNVKSFMSYGRDSLVVVKNDNSLWVTGKNDDGELGDPALSFLSTWTQATAFPQGVREIYGNGKATYGFYSFVATTDNKLYAAGKNTYGQLGLGHKNKVDTWTDITSLLPSPVKNVIYDNVGGGVVYILLTDGSMYTAGANNYSGIGDGTNDDRTTFFLVPFPNIVKAVTNLGRIAFIEDEDGSVYVTGGFNYAGGLFDYNSTMLWRETVGPNSFNPGGAASACP